MNWQALRKGTVVILLGQVLNLKMRVPLFATLVNGNGKLTTSGQGPRVGSIIDFGHTLSDQQWNHPAPTPKITRPMLGSTY